MIDALRGEIAGQGLSADVQVTRCGSLGRCGRGPNMVVYPEGASYSGVRPADVAELVRDQLNAGKVVERLLSDAGVLPDDLQQSINGFRESRTPLTAIELDAFSTVGAEADAPRVAQTLGADPRAGYTESREPTRSYAPMWPVAQVVRAHA